MKNARPANDAKPSALDGADFTEAHQGEQLSFLPPPPFNPSWPTKGTRDDQALQLFLDGQTLDHEDFFAVAGSWRLSDAVLHLRDGGWPIASIAISEPSPKCPGREIARYHLPAKYAAEAMASKKGGAAA